MESEQEGYYWEIEEQDEGDYRLVITYRAMNKVFKKIFKSTLKKLVKKQNLILDDEEVEIKEQFTIPDDLKKVMLPQVYRSCKKHIKNIINEVSKDGVKILSADVIDVYYNKVNESQWLIQIFIIGQMTMN